MAWYLYIARCKDDSLYTGITTDIKRREEEHNTSNILGAKSLRAKRPVKIIYHEAFQSQVEALKRESEVKGWKRRYKLELVLKPTF